MKVAVYIENKSRDLIGSTWLAMNIASYGHEVIIGETASIRNGLDIIEPDVWIRGGLSNSTKKIELSQHLKKAGGALVLVESEGGLRSDKVYKQTIHEEMREYVDLHCTWGRRQADLLCDQLQDYEEKLVISGSPRFDLLAEGLRGIYEKDATRYNKKYQNYILVLTSFAAGNTDNESRSVSNQKKVAYQERLIGKYIGAVQDLAANLEGDIVLRPHPRENEKRYQAELGDIDGVHIVNHGSVRPWILGAEAVVHKSSTAAIESVFLDTPVISYRPLKNQKFDAELPIAISKQAFTYTELYDILNKYRYDQSVTLAPEIRERLKRDFHNIDGAVAAPTIAKAVDSLDTTNNVQLTGVTPSFETKMKRVGIRIFGGDFVEAVGESIFGTDRSGVRNKFPGLSINELEFVIDLISKEWAGEMPKIRVTKFPSLVNTFIMKPRFNQE